ATLMREPSAKRQQLLLHAAYDAGFRHFDVAPSYGFGAAEHALGKFLRSRPEGVTVGTKVGILARGSPGLMRLIQAPARALLRRYPGLRGRATHTVGAAMHTTTNFSVAACTRSLENSLRALGIARIDVLLLHDVRPPDVATDGLLEWLQTQKERGVVLNVGLATSPAAANEILSGRAAFFDAVQVPSNILAPATAVLPDDITRLRLTHGALTYPLGWAEQRVREDPTWARLLSEHAGEDVTTREALARLILAWAYFENPHGVVILGTSKEAHLRSAATALEAFDGTRLAAVSHFMRELASGLGDSC
ncbi:MAG TPA: aldo/keto reductase, partial [Acidobacteriaceae bacterium]|nr:aldo/keto reductase [Acidobacteriaceae bacterium]